MPKYLTILTLFFSLCLIIISAEAINGQTSTGLISVHVEITAPFQQGWVKLTEEYVNTARINSVREISTCALPMDGNVTFQNLPAGKYTITAITQYTDQGTLQYNQVTKYYYYNVTTTTTTWTQTLTLAEERQTKVELKNGTSTSSQTVKYVDYPYNTQPYQNQLTPYPYNYPYQQNK